MIFLKPKQRTEEKTEVRRRTIPAGPPLHEQTAEYQAYAAILEELGKHREKAGVGEPSERPILARIDEAWARMTEDDQVLSRTEGWRAWPDQRRHVRAWLFSDEALSTTDD